MVLLEVTWIFSFHPQAHSLILADRQCWKCWGVWLQPRGCPTPLSHPSPPAQRDWCFQWMLSFVLTVAIVPLGSPKTSAHTGSVVRRVPRPHHPGIEGSQRNCGPGFLFLSSFSASGEAAPFPTRGSHLDPPIPSLPAARGTSEVLGCSF